MPELTSGLFWKMKRLDGSPFMGHLTSTAGVNTKEKAPYRVLHVRKPTFIREGDVVRTFNDEVVILMQHPNDFDWAVSFKAAYAKNTLAWQRLNVAVHPVSGVEVSSGYTSMGTLYVNMDTPEELDLKGLVDTNYRFITGQDVRQDDKVGDFLVRRVVKALGVNVVYTS